MRRIITATVILATISNFAEDIYLKTGDGTGKSSYIEGARWSNEQAPSAGNNYIVKDGLAIRTPPVNVTTAFTNAVFAGDSLTIGSDSSGGNVLVKTTATEDYYNNARVTINDLRLVNKNSFITHGGDWSNSSLYGKITFLVPMSSATFEFVPYFEMPQSRVFNVFSDLCADKGYGFKIIRKSESSAGRVSIMKDNPNFKGFVAVTGDGDYLTVESAGALGLEPDEPTVLINLRALGTFGVHYNDVTIDQPNRGISVTSATGGKLYAAQGRTFKTSMFITTEATKRPLRKIGKGTVLVTGSCDVGNIDVVEGTLGLAGDVLSNVAISNNASFGVASPISTLSLSKAVTFYGSGAFFIPIDETNGKCGTIELKDGFSSNVWPIKFKTDAQMPMACMTQTLFRVSSTVRNISPADFVCVEGSASAEDYMSFIAIDKDEEGMQVVKRIQLPIVRMKETITGSSDNDSHHMNKADPWENDKVPMNGFAYVVGTNQNLRTGAATTGTVVFLGDLLAFKGTSDYTGDSQFLLKAGTTVVSNLVMSGKTVLNVSAASGTGQNKEQIMEGGLTVASGESSRLIITSVLNRLLTLKSSISGDGSIIICPSERNSTKGFMRVGLEGDNSRYLGKFRLSCTTDGSGGNYPDNGDEGVTPVTLFLSNGNQLGGNPHTYYNDGFRISSYCCVMVTNSLELVHPNRAIRIVQNGEFNVAQDATMTITSPLILRLGALVKTGMGTLALGTHVSEKDSEGNTIKLKEGYLKAITTNGVNGIGVVMSQNASIKVDSSNERGTPLGDFGYYNVVRDDPFDLTACDGKLNIVIEDSEGAIAATRTNGKKLDVNILTVNSVAAEALKDNIVCMSDTIITPCDIVCSEPDAEGRVTFTATFASKGFMIIVQ